MTFLDRIGFQAVILCGPGTSLHPFTNAVDLPKALLPIANKPMLYYPLEWCEKAGFDSILILTLAEHIVPIQSYIHSRVSTTATRVEAPSSLDEGLGTADVLRLAYRHGWMTGDFMVIPCDLVTNLDAQEVIKLCMVDQTGFDVSTGRRGSDRTASEDDGGKRGGLGVWYETKGVEGAAKGQEIDLIAVAPRVSTVPGNLSLEATGCLKTLLFNLPAQVVRSDTPKSKIPIRHGLLRRHPNYKILSTRRDSGIYFLPFWVLKFIDKNKKINSIREDLLPWWSKCYWQNKRLAEKLGLIDILAGAAANNIGDMSTTRQRTIEKWTVEGDYEKPAEYSAEIFEKTEKAKRGIVVLPIGDPASKSDMSSTIVLPAEVTIPSVTAYLPNPSAFVRRVDTIQLYLFTSLYLASPSVPSSHKIHVSASIDPKATVSRMDCLIAAKVSVAEKAVIKRCVLGHGVSIGKGAKLLGCVLMEGASVAEGANLEGCVVGRHAVIGVEAKLKDCQVAEGFFVEEEIQARNECFVAFSGLDHDPGVSGLGLDGAYDAKDYTANKKHNQEKINYWNKHSAAATMGNLEEQKENTNVERIEKADEGRKDPSAEQGKIGLQDGDGQAAPHEGISLVSASVKAEAPEMPVGMTLWWLPRLLWVWAVPIISLGFWYAATKYGEKVKFAQPNNGVLRA